MVAIPNAVCICWQRRRIQMAKMRRGDITYQTAAMCLELRMACDLCTLLLPMGAYQFVNSFSSRQPSFLLLLVNALRNRADVGATWPILSYFRCIGREELERQEPMMDRLHTTWSLMTRSQPPSTSSAGRSSLGWRTTRKPSPKSPSPSQRRPGMAVE